ncbi:MAG: hypothetical protein WAZ77_13805 [Candidatus Nitrosopolaris sp.]|jgi:hypothetical protein
MTPSEKGAEAEMTPSEEAYKQCEATPEEIAEAQALNPDLKPEQIAEKIAQMKDQVGRERCHECGQWSGGWVSFYESAMEPYTCLKCRFGGFDGMLQKIFEQCKEKGGIGHCWKCGSEIPLAGFWHLENINLECAKCNAKGGGSFRTIFSLN